MQGEFFQIGDELADGCGSVIGAICKVGFKAYAPFVVAGVRNQADVSDFLLSLLVYQCDASEVNLS